MDQFGIIDKENEGGGVDFRLGGVEDFELLTVGACKTVSGGCLVDDAVNFWGLYPFEPFLIDLAYIFWLTYGLLAVLYHSPGKAALTTGSTPA